MSEDNKKRPRAGIILSDTNGIEIEVALIVADLPEMIPILYSASKIIGYLRNACNLPGFQTNHTIRAERQNAMPLTSMVKMSNDLNCLFKKRIEKKSS